MPETILPAPCRYCGVLLTQVVGSDPLKHRFATAEGGTQCEVAHDHWVDQPFVAIAADGSVKVWVKAP